jgi:hypothetical protein
VWRCPGLGTAFPGPWPYGAAERAPVCATLCEIE